MKRKLLEFIAHHHLPLSITLACVLMISGGVAIVIYQTGQRVAHEGQTVVNAPRPQAPKSLKAASINTPTTNQPVITGSSTTPAVDPTPCANNTSGKLVLVSISQQHAWACDATTDANDSPVTTGASGIKNVDDSTPTGTWHVLSKQQNVHLRGHDVNGSWDDAVQYWMPFIGNSYGFHDASWQTMPFGDPQYTLLGSHGCVHMPTAFIAWLYGWTPVGTTVTIES